MRRSLPRVQQPQDDHQLAHVVGRVVGGEDDLFTPVAHTDRITELLPDAVALRLKDCGHLGMIEHAEAVTELLEDLLDRVRAAH